jgi:hypothetical protein
MLIDARPRRINIAAGAEITSVTFPSVASAGAKRIREELRPVLFLAGAAHVDTAKVGSSEGGIKDIEEREEGEGEKTESEHGKSLCR